MSEVGYSKEKSQNEVTITPGWANHQKRRGKLPFVGGCCKSTRWTLHSAPASAGVKTATTGLGNLCITPCGLRGPGLGQSTALLFLPIARLLAAKSALWPIPIRTRASSRGLCRASLVHSQKKAVVGDKKLPLTAMCVISRWPLRQAALHQ